MAANAQSWQGNVAALGKSMDVLEAVVAEDRPLALSDISEQIGLPRQTVHRILGQLEGNGLLRREPTRERYVAGPRLSRLALDVLNSAHYAAPIRAILRDLVARIGETCNIGVLDGGEAVYLDRVECDWPLRLQLQAGSRRPIHTSAIGKLLLAHLPSRSRRRVLASGPFERFTAHTIIDPEALELEMAAIRRQDYALNDQGEVDGVIGLAVPVRGRDGGIIAGLAVHAPVARMNAAQGLERLPDLHAAAARLSQVLDADDEE